MPLIRRMWRAWRQRAARRRAADDDAALRRRMRDLADLAHGPILQGLARTSGWEALTVRATSRPDRSVGLELSFGEEHGIGKLVLDQTGGGGMVSWPDGATLTPGVGTDGPFHVVELPGWLLVWSEHRPSDEAIAEAKRLRSLASP